MLKYIKILLAGIVVSFYFFPFEFTFMPGVNTKMAMAAVGLVLYPLALAKGRAPQIDKNGFIIALISAVVSLWGLVAVIANNTNDYTYATYIVSMFVWLGGAYTAVRLVKCMHGHVSILLISNYLIGVCVAQCILALVIDTVPAFKHLVDSYVIGFDFVQTDKLNKAGRLYGIGAALDVAGTRFSAVLVMIAFIVKHLTYTKFSKSVWLYFAAFIFISVVGNMLARTTTVGILVALAYWVMTSSMFNVSTDKNKVNVRKYVLCALCVAVPIVVYLCSVNQQFYDNIRFAFEGFFSIAENGKWETNSNNILKDMVVFPDNFKTWVIGDGYLDDPFHKDPYYVGPDYNGYYMATDIGYLRFIFYFGLMGLATFIIYFFKVARTCAERFPKYAVMFMLVLCINMIIWLKVASDIFLVFAIFLCISKEENDHYENLISDKLDI